MVKDEKAIQAEKDDFSEWFTELMIKADLADYTDVSGAIVFRPASYSIWEKIKEETDKRFKKLGIKNAYFPLFIPEKFLEKEADHIEGFNPEVAWVTHTGSNELSERLAVRPTSEAIMYPTYSKWIRSWRDLPLKINQWNNVVRWEFKHPVPFLRTREFLWNELHTALASEKEALKEGQEVMKAYKDVCEDYLGLYGIYGRKTDKEKFAGAVFSEKIHYVMPNGKAIEGCCFHHDGQNFAKAYDIKFTDVDEKEQYVWQNTYAISTRLLGVMFAVHSDEKGLVIPPKVASNKAVIVPILIKGKEDEVIKKAEEVAEALKSFNVFVDARQEYKPGYKFNEWEMKGIPLRIELGPKDLEKQQVVLVRRDSGEKLEVSFKDVEKVVKKTLDDVQKSLFENSKKLLLGSLDEADSLDILKEKIKEKKIVNVPLCSLRECEDVLKAESAGVKSLWIDSNRKVNEEKCIVCGNDSDYWAYVGKSY